MIGTKMGLILVAVAMAFSVDNVEFLKTVESQIAEGYTWNGIECREPLPNLPAMPMTLPDGRQVVCSKLTK